ncbi:hypothetical protein WJX79_001741 [Trebouxia sp. C0005]
MPSNKVLSAKGATSTIGEDDAGCKEPNVVDNPVGEKSNKQAHAQENRSGNRQDKGNSGACKKIVSIPRKARRGARYQKAKCWIAT